MLYAHLFGKSAELLKAGMPGTFRLLGTAGSAARSVRSPLLRGILFATLLSAAFAMVFHDYPDGAHDLYSDLHLLCDNVDRDAVQKALQAADADADREVLNGTLSQCLHRAFAVLYGHLADSLLGIPYPAIAVRAVAGFSPLSSGLSPPSFA